MRVKIDTIAAEVVSEMKTLHTIKTNKELIEKCIMFCFENKVQLNHSNPKSINDMYAILQKLNTKIEELPLKIAMVLESES